MLDERARELAGEYKHWLDLKRTPAWTGYPSTTHSPG
ncbi:RagB/SusD family nutrient uptake outer membrane protein [Dyadobacter sandarakinus]|nr:RagB/SusD family nutrient uptake outer membrane protein [Dyadobacter sandarakinus]